MKNKVNIRLILNISTLCVCLFLLISVMLAWYTTNTTVSASGISATSSDSKNVNFDEIVKTKRVNLNGDIIDSEYKIASNGNLFLTKRVTTVSGVAGDEEIHEVSEKIPFSIETMLPGEYIDIQIGFSINDEYNGKNFKVKLNKISGDSFIVDGKTHYASGAFKIQNISLRKETENGEDILPSNQKEIVWLNEYDIDNNDAINNEKLILGSTWDSSYNKLYYTFRITEDFTQYYALIAKASGSYGALLSKKKLYIDQIFFML